MPLHNFISANVFDAIHKCRQFGRICIAKNFALKYQGIIHAKLPSLKAYFYGMGGFFAIQMFCSIFKRAFSYKFPDNAVLGYILRRNGSKV